jgi:predicted acylesterase/phospholipase RssA
LIVTAVDVANGESHLFDSGDNEITAADVVACCSLPPMFPAKEISGSYYWDGGLWSNTPLREVLNALQKATTIQDDYHVYIIDTFPKEGCVPQNNWQVFGRMSEITYADKTVYDLKGIDLVNEYIDLVQVLGAQTERKLSSMNLKYYKEIVAKKRVHVEVTIIPRLPFRDEKEKKAESISREIDFSRTRIEELWRQGCKKAWEELGLPLPSPCG